MTKTEIIVWDVEADEERLAVRFNTADYEAEEMRALACRFAEEICEPGQSVTVLQKEIEVW